MRVAARIYKTTAQVKLLYANHNFSLYYRSPYSYFGGNQIIRHIKGELRLCLFAKHEISEYCNSSIQHRTESKAAIQENLILIKQNLYEFDMKFIIMV